MLRVSQRSVALVQQNSVDGDGDLTPPYQISLETIEQLKQNIPVIRNHKCDKLQQHMSFWIWSVNLVMIKIEMLDMMGRLTTGLVTHRSAKVTIHLTGLMGQYELLLALQRKTGVAEGQTFSTNEAWDCHSYQGKSLEGFSVRMLDGLVRW